MLAQTFRLRKHADFQRVYKSSRKQFSGQMAYFFALRPQPDPTPVRPGLASAQPEPGRLSLKPATTALGEGPRIGLTVGRVMGKAVERNRIKRRMREAVRRHLAELTLPVDVVLHPKRTVLAADFAALEREVAHVFRAIARSADKQAGSRAAAPQPEPAP